MNTNPKPRERSHSFRIPALLTLSFYLISLFPSPPAASGNPALRAQPVSSLSIKIPKNLGTVEAAYLGKLPYQVILIQDAHAIPDAQRHIEGILEHLSEHYSIAFVGAEGSASRLDPQFFRSFPDQAKLKEILKSKYERGEISGITAAALFGKKPLVYQGLEDWNLYEQGLFLFLSASQDKHSIAAAFQSVSDDLNKRKLKIFHSDLLTTQEVLSNFQENRTSFMEALHQLSKIRRPRKGSELELLIAESHRSESADLGREVRALYKDVESALKRLARTSNDLESLNQHFQDFQTSRTNAQAFGLILKSVIEKYHFPFKLSINLEKLTNDERRLKDIAGSRLFRDFERYTQSTFWKLIHQNGKDWTAAAQIYRKLEILQLLKKMEQLEITRAEWKRLQRIGENSVLYDSNLRRLRGKLAKHFEFYRNTELRDQALFRNLSANLFKTKTATAAAVVGGFHTEGMLQQLRQAQISYVLVRPELTVPETNTYRQLMKGDVSWKSYLKEENGRISPYHAFLRCVRDELLQSAGSRALSLMPGSLLKDWRDQIVIDLAQANRLGDAYQYTQYLDEVLSEPSPAEKFRQEWKRNGEEFIQALKELDSKNQLTNENVFALLNHATLALTGVLGVSDTLRTRFDESPKAEMRTLAPAAAPHIQAFSFSQIKISLFRQNEALNEKISVGKRFLRTRFSEFLTALLVLSTDAQALWTRTREKASAQEPLRPKIVKLVSSFKAALVTIYELTSIHEEPLDLIKLRARVTELTARREMLNTDITARLEFVERQSQVRWNEVKPWNYFFLARIYGVLHNFPELPLRELFSPISSVKLWWTGRQLHPALWELKNAERSELRKVVEPPVLDNVVNVVEEATQNNIRTEEKIKETRGKIVANKKTLETLAGLQRKIAASQLPSQQKPQAEKNTGEKSELRKVPAIVNTRNQVFPQNLKIFSSVNGLNTVARWLAPASLPQSWGSRPSDTEVKIALTSFESVEFEPLMKGLPRVIEDQSNRLLSPLLVPSINNSEDIREMENAANITRDLRAIPEGSSITVELDPAQMKEITKSGSDWVLQWMKTIVRMFESTPIEEFKAVIPKQYISQLKAALPTKDNLPFKVGSEKGTIRFYRAELRHIEHRILVSSREVPFNKDVQHLATSRDTRGNRIQVNGLSPALFSVIAGVALSRRTIEGLAYDPSKNEFRFTKSNILSIFEPLLNFIRAELRTRTSA